MMRRSSFVWSAALPSLIVLLFSACGGSSSSSGHHQKATATPTATATPISSVQAQAPVNGAVAIVGNPGTALGGGSVSGTVGGGTAQTAALGSGCGASGIGNVHPDGSFSFAICASVGDQISLNHTAGGQTTQLGFVVVPQTTSLPTCPTGFRTFKYTNASNNDLWIGLATGAGPPPVTCTVSDQSTCGPNQNCLPTNSCTSYTQCASANQCDTNTGVCMDTTGSCAGGSQSSTVTLSQNECVGRTGVSCTVNGCDTNFTCDATTGLCTTTVPSLQNDSSCSTTANCGSSTSCTWTNMVSECTGGSCFFSQINPGENTACSMTSQCPTGQVCNTNLGLCQYTPSSIPQNDLELTPSESTVVCLPGGVAPSSVWASGKINDTTTKCTQDSQCASGRCYITGTSGPLAPHVPPSATDCSQAQMGQTCTCSAIIGWSGNTFARTGCQDDGTQCQTGDCVNTAYQNCPVGKGGTPPDTLAEFTLQTNATDFYDVSVINGVNTSVQMAPDAASSPAAPPDGAQYWCETPGSTSAQTGGLTACSWNFNVTSIAPSASATPGDQTPLLTQIFLPSCNPNTQGCPAGSACTSTGSDPTTGAATYTCIPNQQACATSSQCPSGLACVNGFCSLSTVCSSNSDCPGTAPNCSNGYCVPGCSTDNDCANSKTALESATCQNSICMPLTCDSTTPVACPAGFSCSTTSGFGVCQPTQTTCSATQPCPSAHQVCSIPSGQMSGTCVTQSECPLDGSCSTGNACSSGNCVPDTCSSDADCSSVGGTCNTSTQQCQPFGCDSTTLCPSGMTCSANGTCIASCTSESACASSPFGASCGTGLIGGDLIQTCGSPTGGLWTYDDFCPFVGASQQFGPVNCNAIAQTAPSGTDTIANMFGCNGTGQGSATSCYNTAAANSFCCGCPTASGVAPDWPTVLSSSFTNCTQTSSAWEDNVLPWLHYLKDGCPTAYSFPFDDATSTFTCYTTGTGNVPAPGPSATVSPTPIPNAMNYDITFGTFTVNSPTASPTP